MNLIKTFALSIFTLLMVAVPVGAVEVSEKTVINAPVTEVWSKIGGWCAIKDWHPAVAACIETREKDVLRRVLSLEGGGEIVERLTNENETSYSYDIESGPLPVENYKATLSIAAEGKDKSIVTWSSTFEAKGVTEKEAAAVIKGVYEGGFQALAKDMN